MSTIQSIIKLRPNSTDADLSLFLTLSSELVGYPEVELEGIGMLEEYYFTLMKEQDQDGIRLFFEKARQILKGGNDRHREIKKAFIDLPDTTTGPDIPFDEMRYQGLAPRIILLWYSGVWTTMNWKDQKSQQERTAIVSSRAYEQGLIWVTAQTHPAGAKEPGYNSWSNPPL
jgi:hypothetical protein